MTIIEIAVWLKAIVRCYQLWNFRVKIWKKNDWIGEYNIRGEIEPYVVLMFLETYVKVQMFTSNQLFLIDPYFKATSLVNIKEKIVQ